MTDLSGLIARVEKASGPDRELGFEILLSCGWRRTCVGFFCGPIYHWSSPDGSLSYSEDGMPCPTRSIDAALTLLPEGLSVKMGNDYGPCWAGIWIKTNCNFSEFGRAATLPLALLAAILRARQAQAAEARE